MPKKKNRQGLSWTGRPSATWVAAYVAWAGFGPLMTAGCKPADGIERVYVSGSITYQDKPVEAGQIRFIPQGGTKGPTTIESFRSGRFETSTSGGVPRGTHRVEILGYSAQDFDNWPTGPGSPPLPQLLPNKYNRNSELVLETPSGEEEMVRDFALPR